MAIEKLKFRVVQTKTIQFADETLKCYYTNETLWKEPFLSCYLAFSKIILPSWNAVNKWILQSVTKLYM